MSPIFTALSNSLPVFVTIFMTLFLKRIGVFNDKMRDGIKPLLFKFILPVFAFNALFGISLDVSKTNLAIYALIFEVILLSGILLLNIFFKFSKKNLGTLLIIMLTFGVGSFAYPFIQLNFSDDVFREVVIIDIALFVTVLVFGPIIGNIFSGKSKASFLSIIKSVVMDPVLIAVVLSLLLTATGVKLPEPINNTLDLISKGFTLIVLVYIALSLEMPNFKQILNLALVTFYRIALAILFVFILLKLTNTTIDFMKSLPLALITPFSSFGVIYGEEYGLNPIKAAQLVIFSIIVLIFLYPLLIAFLL